MPDTTFQTDPEQLDETLKKIVDKLLADKVIPEIEKGMENMLTQMAAQKLGEGLAQQTTSQNLADPEQARNAIENFGEEKEYEGESEDEKGKKTKEKTPEKKAKDTGKPAPENKEGEDEKSESDKNEEGKEDEDNEGKKGEKTEQKTPEKKSEQHGDKEKTNEQPTKEEQPQPPANEQQSPAGAQPPEQATAPGGEKQAGQPTPPAGEQTDQQAPAAGGEAPSESGEAPTDKKTEKNYEPKGQMMTLQRGEKSGLTQNINRLRNHKELKNIDNNIKTAEKDIKNITKKLKKPLKELQKKQREKARINGTIFLLKIIKAILYILCLLGITLAAVPFVKSAITTLRKKQEILENEIKTQKKEVEKDMNSKAQANIKIANLEHQRHNIVNRSLLESNAKQSEQEQQNDSDVGIA